MKLQEVFDMLDKIKVNIKTENEEFYSYLINGKLPDYNNVFLEKNSFHGMDMIGLYDMNNISQTRIYRKDIIEVKLWNTNNILTDY